MLSIKELFIKNNQQGLTLVDNLSFTVNKNDKIAIIGTEGSGKSTLLSVIKGEIMDYITVSGSIIRPQVIAYLKQNIALNDKDKTVLEYLTKTSEELYFDYNELMKTCRSFNLDYNLIKDRKIGSFSGGEKVKIGLLKIFLQKPDLILLDEPSNDLDFETLQFLESFLINTDVPTIFVSHDQELLENVSTGIIHLAHIKKKSQAKTVFLNVNYKEYKDNYINSFLSNTMIAKKQRSDFKIKEERFQKIYHKVKHQQNQAVRNPTLGSLLKKKMKNLKSLEKRLEKEKEDFLEIPEKEEAMNLFFTNTLKPNNKKELLNFDSKELLLKNGQIIPNIKLTITGTKKLAIIGKNGVGKTTMLKEIRKSFDQKEIKYGYLSQDYYEVLNENENVIDFFTRAQSNLDITKIRQILGNLGIKREEMLYQIKDLSEGSKLKVLLLYLTAIKTEVLLLDEPTRNLSPLNQDELYSLFINYPYAIIAVTHDRSFIKTVFDDIYELTTSGLEKLT